MAIMWVGATFCEISCKHVSGVLSLLTCGHLLTFFQCLVRQLQAHTDIWHQEAGCVVSPCSPR